MTNDCTYCQMNASLEMQGVWIHARVYTHDPSKSLPGLQSLSVNITNNTTNIKTLTRIPMDNVFVSRDEYLKKLHVNRDDLLNKDGSYSLGTANKPFGALWWSHGRWLFDNLCDTLCQDHNTCPTKLQTTPDIRLYVISMTDLDLSKILLVETEEQLDSFELRYCTYNNGFDDSKALFAVKDVNWNLVRSHGFSGCIFNFNRGDRLMWDSFLYTYDVESLVLWDWNCVKTVIPITSSIDIEI